MPPELHGKLCCTMTLEKLMIYCEKNSLPFIEKF